MLKNKLLIENMTYFFIFFYTLLHNILNRIMLTNNMGNIKNLKSYILGLFH